ncbi:DUF2637 domain-containing protein [Streptomyces sp. NPDC048664]|uniref:DUF2637 domain-containing protein n=1 Tax=Streptomyces sp. NPDC048664 TaxID=3154505 RepID=UPI0034247E94
MAAPLQLTRMHRVLIGVVVTGAVVIAGIGFAGSYAAVRALALKKGFGDFSYVFPIGIDAGICVLLALDLLLTWIRIPFPLLRQTAWLLTAATIAFNGAAAWPDPLGVGMHAVIPVLFVVAVEAARHAVGRIADITADKHMEGVRLTRWLLSPLPTFLLWRRMKLWELRSYEQVIKLEQERLVYQARLRSRFGRAWRRKAPVESLMPLRLARYGVPLAETAPSGLAAAGIEPQLIPAVAATQPETVAVAPAAAPAAGELESGAPQPPQAPQTPQAPQAPQAPQPSGAPGQPPAGAEASSQWFQTHPQAQQYHGGYDPNFQPPSYDPEQQDQPWWYENQLQHIPVPQPRSPEPDAETQQTQAQAQAQAQGQAQGQAQEQTAAPRPQDSEATDATEPPFQVPNGAGGMRPMGEGVQEATPSDEELYQVFRQSIAGEGMPTPGAFAANVEAAYGLRLKSRELNQYMDQFAARLNSELMEDHIA